eukprot:augustus_masked-scaffold_3-processed-gene-16.8-mRNA-1 protein AED:0.05 eAED:0.05 QI:0/-1/0/1/-1/1/1/0/233
MKGVLDNGVLVPNFTAETQLGELRFHDYISDSWCLFFAHPSDFTPVCTTEFGKVSSLEKEFQARNCKIVGISVDSVESHKKWIEDINETQETEVRFPIVADETGEVCNLFKMSTVVKPTPNLFNQNEEVKQIEEAEVQYSITKRTLYLIDPSKRVALSMVYPSEVGRNFDEIIRVLDALTVTIHHPVGTPANWNYGEDVLILPGLEKEKIDEKFPKGFKEIKPYLMITPMPEE